MKIFNEPVLYLNKDEVHALFTAASLLKNIANKDENNLLFSRASEEDGMALNFYDVATCITNLVTAAGMEKEGD